MNVGVFLPEVFNQHAGGVYNYNLSLIGALAKTESKKITFSLISYNDFSIENWDSSFNKIILNNNKSKKLYVFRLIRKIIGYKNIYINSAINQIHSDYIKSNQIDLIYYITERFCLDYNFPYITNVWDLGHLNVPYFEEIGGKGNYKIRENGFKEVLKRACFVVAESEEGKNDITFYYQIKPKKIQVLPLYAGPVINCHATKEIEFAFLKNHKLEKENYIFYPAQYWSHKNHYAILQSLYKIKKKYGVIIKAVFTGSDKGNLTYLKETANKLALSDQVYFLGFLDLQQINILYKNALALVMPTFLGPTNMPLVEAIALKCPVICSNFEGQQEQVGGNALFFEPGDYDQLLEHIMRLYKHKDLRSDLIQRAETYYQTSLNKVEYCASQIVDICLEAKKILNTRAEV